MKSAVSPEGRQEKRREETSQFTERERGSEKNIHHSYQHISFHLLFQYLERRSDDLKLVNMRGVALLVAISSSLFLFLEESSATATTSSSIKPSLPSTNNGHGRKGDMRDKGDDSLRTAFWGIASTKKSKSVIESFLKVSAGRVHQHVSDVRVSNIRGGDLHAKDSNIALFTKVGCKTLLEAGGMLAIITGTRKLTDIVPSLPTISGLSLVQWLGLLVVIFASSLIGGGVSAATSQTLRPNVTPGDPNWYAELKKPVWNPPGWLFPIMWLIVSKPTQLAAVARLLQQPTTKWVPLAVYCSHLALGDSWNTVFFEYQSPGRGAAVILCFYAVLLSSAFLFYQEDPLSGLLLLPTCGW